MYFVLLPFLSLTRNGNLEVKRQEDRIENITSPGRGQMSKNKMYGVCRMAHSDILYDTKTEDVITIRMKTCNECYMITEKLKEFCEERNHYERQQWKEWFDYFLRHDPVTHTTTQKKTGHHIGNGKDSGIFAGTLTMSPEDATNEAEMCSSISKIMAQQTCPVKRYAWYLEHTENGLPHIHFIYETESRGRIHQKVFKRYWKTWDEKQKIGRGFRGGYHKYVESETAYKEYIEKDGGRHVDKWTN